ncbi:MAG: hypothetical protein ACKESB_03170 [Candidatus Hodgkinia cicadicola]
MIISVKSRLRATETVPLVEVGSLSCDEKRESLSSSVVEQQRGRGQRALLLMVLS